VSRFNFEEPTIFGVTEDTRANHRLNVSYEVRQPWGSSNLSVDARNFLDDFALHRVRVSGRLRFRVARGFDLNASGSFTRIKDQIFLQGGRPDRRGDPVAAAPARDELRIPLEFRTQLHVRLDLQ